MSTLKTTKSVILSVTRRTKKGFTVGEIFDRVLELAARNGQFPPSYSGVRRCVYELNDANVLRVTGVRPDKHSKRSSYTFARGN